jgi:predicted nucleic acid-binding protein
MRLYLDAAPVIYAVEQVAPFFPVVDARLSTSGTVRVASDLTRMECRVKPVREGNADLLKDYDDFFAYAVMEIVALSREVMDRATEIRARYRFKTPDAVHLAAAVMTSCDMFLTNDHRLDRFPDISIEVVGP